jgi:hypothetical protein
MVQRTRSVRLRVIWSAALLLAALLVYLGSLVIAASGFALALFVLAATCMLTGITLAMVAVVAGTRVANRSQHVTLLWSLWSLALLLATGLVVLGADGLLATPACRVGCIHSIATAELALLLTALLGGAGILAGIGAGVAGVISAAKSRNWTWAVGLLAYLLGSLLGAALIELLVLQHVLAVDSPVVVLFVSPLLLPVLSLLYSLTGRQRHAQP